MTEKLKPKLGAILLAAGGSSRLGRPKQLLDFEGESLLRRAARTLTQTNYFPIVVVLGAEREASFAELEGLTVFSTINPSWTKGLSSSIQSGLEKIIDIEPEVEGVLITLCDQPLISPQMMDRFTERYLETSAGVIAAAYDGVAGVPALFNRSLFGELMALEGDQGARSLIRGSSDLSLIELPEAKFDVDTQDDLKNLSD